MKKILFLILAILAALVAGGCDFEWGHGDESATLTADEPGIILINESGVTLYTIYNPVSGVTVKAVIEDGEEYEFESGVSRFVLSADYPDEIEEEKAFHGAGAD